MWEACSTAGQVLSRGGPAKPSTPCTRPLHEGGSSQLLRPGLWGPGFDFVLLCFAHTPLGANQCRPCEPMRMRTNRATPCQGSTNGSHPQRKGAANQSKG